MTVPESVAVSAYDFAEYRLEPARRSLTSSDGAPLKVSGKAFDVLVYLVQHAGEVVDRDALLHAVWPRRVVEDNNVNQVITGLRRTLGSQHIVTIAGRGYQFVTPVRSAALEQTAEPTQTSSEQPALLVEHVDDNQSDGRQTAVVPDARAPARRSTVAWPWVASALLALAVALYAIESQRPAPRSSTARIAVLPCDNLSPDPNDSYFAPGMHEELLTRLAQIRDLRVISRLSVVQYGPDRPSIRKIASRLGVDAIVECGVRYNGRQVMLTVHLIDAATDEHVWSRSYPADMSDLRALFERQADIAIDVANTLRVQLLDDERERIARVPTQSKEAYAYYMAARSTPATRAIELVDHALSADPEFVDALILKTGLHMVVAGLKARDQSDADLEAALKAANRALELDPNSAGARAALATYRGQTGEWIESEREWRHAFALGYPPGGGAYFLFKMSVGHIGDAVTGMEQNLERDPLAQGSRSMLLMAYAMLGNSEKRRQHWKIGEELFVGSWHGDLMEPHLRLAENDREFVKTVTPPLPGMKAVWDVGVANLDSPEHGLAALKSLHANPELHSADTLASMTTWALYFGDSALALQWFREAVDLQSTRMLGAWVPLFEGLRREPGFKDLVRDQKLPEYWREYGWPKFCWATQGNDFECD